MSISLQSETILSCRRVSAGSLLLESKIQPDTAYQKQQETLIVWSEGDNFDLALSFQEKAGCDEIWEKICQVQGKDPSVDITQASHRHGFGPFCIFIFILYSYLFYIFGFLYYFSGLRSLNEDLSIATAGRAIDGGRK